MAAEASGNPWENFRTHLPVLLKRLDGKALVPVLYSKHVIDYDEFEELSFPNVTNKSIVEKLARILSRKLPVDINYTRFREALLSIQGQQYLVDEYFPAI